MPVHVCVQSSHSVPEELQAHLSFHLLTHEALTADRSACLPHASCSTCDPLRPTRTGMAVSTAAH
jgi:hypothetical protein